MELKGNSVMPREGKTQFPCMKMDIDDTNFFSGVEDKTHRYTFFECVNILLMASLIILVFMQVVGRFLMRSGGLAWTDELSRIVFVAIVYFSLGVVTKYDLHFKADIFTNASPQFRKVQNMVSNLLAIVVMVTLAVQGVLLLDMTKSALTSALQWPIAVFYLPLTIGSLGMAYYSVKRLIAELKGARE